MKLYDYDIAMPLPPALSIPQSRAAAAQKFKDETQRLCCLAAGFLLQKHLGITDDAQLCYGKNGKPMLRNGSVYFNLSHSGSRVVLAVDSSPVGVDIEQIRPFDTEILRRVCTKEEQEYLKNRDGTAFFKLWTAKESIMKALGVGFSLAPASFCVLPLQDGLHKTAAGYFYISWLLFDGFALCAASPNEIKSLSISK